MTKPPFAVFDIDGTLIRWQLYHAVVNRLAKAELLGNDAKAQLKQAMMVWKRRESPDAFKTYQKLLVNVYEESLPNINAAIFDKIVTSVIDEYKDQTYTYTKQLIGELRDKGHKLFIISGSHIELIEQLGKYYGFDDWIGTKYERNHTNFTGKISINSLDKKKSLETLLKRNNVTSSGSIGIGDTKSDIPILQAVEMPIAFNPNKILLEEAVKNGWKIVIERKDVIYELQQDSQDYKLTKIDFN